MTTVTRTLCLAAAVAALFAACGPPPYSMELPDELRRFEESDDYKLITADGVMVKAREVENYPEATLDFWVDALERHLVAQGYVLDSNECFETDGGREACTLDFLLPHGADDWVLSTTLMLVDDEILLLEAAGPYDRFAEVEESLDAALRTFDPGN